MKVLLGTAGSAAGAVTLTGAATSDTVAAVLVRLPCGTLAKAPSGSFESSISVNDQIQQATPLRTSVSYSGGSPVYTLPDSTTAANPDPTQKDYAGCQIIVFIA